MGRHDGSSGRDEGRGDVDHGGDDRRDVVSIDCRTCAMQDTVACDDCVVTFICSRTPDDAVVVDVDEWRAVRLLQDAGLVPRLRHRSKTG